MIAFWLAVAVLPLVACGFVVGFFVGVHVGPMPAPRWLRALVERAAK